MKKMLCIIFTVMLCYTFLHAKPEISFKETVFDFGEIFESNGVVHHSFIFTNVGDEPLEILKVSSS